MDIVCSHGDWKNRQLGLPNHVILADRDFREKWRIRWETYDAELAEPLVARTADAPLPRLWIPDSPVSSISRAESPVYLLLHPRQWRSAIWANGRATSVRMLEAFQDRVPLRVRQKQSATDQLQE